MPEKKEKEKEVFKCSNVACYNDATFKGTATKETLDDVKASIRNLVQEGTWYYCDKHKKEVERYGHIKFEPL